MNIDNRYEEIVYSRYKVRVNDMAILEVDEGFEKILGFTAADVRERNLSVQDIILEEDWEDYYRIVYSKMGSTGEAYLGHRLRKKTGEVIFVFCFGWVSHIDANGDIYGDVLITDITKTKNMREQLKNLEGINSELNHELADKNRMQESILNNVGGGVGVFDIRNKQILVQYISESFYKMFHLKKGQIGTEGNDFINLAFPEDRKELKKQIQKTLLSNSLTMGEYRFINKNNPKEYFWVQVCLTLLAARKSVFSICAVCIDITDKKESELEKNAQTELLKLVAQGSDELLLSYDVSNDRMIISRYMDGKTKTIYDDSGFLAGLDKCNLIYHDDKESIRHVIRDLKAKKEKAAVEMRIDFTESRSYLWHRASLVSIPDNNGVIRKIVGKLYSIHEEKMRSQELILRAERDSLTGIYTHSTFASKVSSFLREFEGSLCALYMVDLDDFKLVNDALGHYSGDDLLCDTAVVLESLANTYGGFCGRLGGDEFAMFLPDITNEETALLIARTMNKGIRDIKCKTAHSASVGISVNTISKQLDFDKLYYQADQALYYSKRQGKDRYMLFRENMEQTKPVLGESLSSYSDEEDYLLDDISDVVYLTDINTYELKFMNKAAKRNLGIDEDDSSYMNQKCYKILQGLDKPCSFCTSKLLSSDKSLISHHKNLNNEKEYVLKDRLVSWNGIKCRMEMAVDISDADKVTQALSNRYDVEEALVSSITQISMGREHTFSYNKLLETIGEYYGAKHACLIECDGNNLEEIHEWKSANSIAFGEKLNIFFDKQVIQEMREISSRKGALIINHIADYPYKESPLYEFCSENRIWSVYSVPIKDGKSETIGRMIIFNPQLHSGDLKLMNLLSMYIGYDIASRALAEERNYELTHDHVTKALNRSCYMEYSNIRKNLDSIGIVLIDINEVRNIFDEFGQAFVDNLMVEYFSLLQKTFPKDAIYRIGDDDFAVICENVSKNDFLDKIGRLKGQLKIGEFSACMGYVWDDYDKDIHKMERHASDMLYMEKQKWYEMKDEHSCKWSTLTRELVKEDIAKGMFSVVLQPKVDYANDRCYGAEALVRYAKQDNLANLIERLEKSKNIKYMDLYVLKNVCKTLVRWRDEGLPMIPISCNFSRISLLEEDMPDKINEIVEEYGVPKEMIEIEITESIGEMEYEMVTRIANRLHSCGFRIAMDDFGTKYSNVAILSAMKFDVIKLDRSMVYNIDKNADSRKILKHLVEMCRDLEIECIAEGVETKEQAEYLKEMGCNHIQGFLYSKPVNVETFEKIYINQTE